jgi:hypothetical protein
MKKIRIKETPVFLYYYLQNKIPVLVGLMKELAKNRAVHGMFLDS